MATAVDGTVHVQDIEATATSKEVYTTDKVDNLLKEYGKKEDVQTNKDDIAALQTTITGQGNKITANTTQIANNKDAIDKKIDMVTANATYATKDALRDLEDTVGDKADEAAVTTLDGRVGVVEGKVTTLEGTVGDASRGLVKDVADLKTQGTTLTNALVNKADQSDLDAAKAKITANEGNITALQNKTAKLSLDGTALNGMTTVETGALKVTGGISNGMGVTTTLTDIDNSMKQTATNTTAINDLKTKTTTQQNAINGLDAKTTKITYDVAKGTNVDGVTFNAGKVTGVTSINGIDIGDAQVDMKGKNLTGVGTINGTKIGTNVDGNYIHQDHSIWGNMKNVDTQVGKNAEAIAQEKTDREAADTDLSKRIGTVTDDGEYIKKSATNNVSENLKVLDSRAKVNAEAIAKETADRKAAIGQLTVNGYYIEKDKNVSDNLVKLDNQAKANADAIVETDKRTGGIKRNLEGNQTTIEDKVTVNHSGDVAGVKGLSAETITTTGNASIGGDLKVAGTITTDKMVFGDKATNNYTEIDKGHITSKNDALAGDATKKSSSMELDHSKLEVGVADKDSNGHLTMTADKTSIKNSDLTEKNYSEIVADKDSVKTTVKDEKGNTTSTKSSATEIRNYAKDKDGNKTINVQTATQNKSWAKDKDGNESSIVQTGKDITNTAEKGTITSKAKDIVNDASGNISNNSQTMYTTVTGKATESYGSLDTTVNGNETHIVKGTKTETVDGKVTENYKAGQATNVTGNQDIHVTKNQTNKIDGDQVNIIGGSQTTTATDINRNASSSMIDKVDNAYGTNTETKVAGKTTTDVSIKGTGEEGKYIRGANESRDYLIKGTLKNSETKTVDATSTEITDGKGKTSATIQDKTQISGSVTNGTSSAVSNVKADSIDTAVKEGTNTSLISQKKDSITSAVGNGTTSTVIQQGDKDITIASNGGTVGIVGKDIINNATNEITNTAGTKITDKVGNNTRVIDQTSITDTVGTASRKIEDGKITDTAGDSTVTTENGKGTTFAKVGSAAYSTEAGATKDTNIAGNHITTGRVDANELGVSDKDDQGNTADLSVKAGEGVKASASDGTTTGSLDVTADEVGSTVKDASGKGSTFKQRIDAIMMESKNVSIKAEETLTNEAKVITNRASEVINNEAININNTATGIIKSKASEIQNQADKLISNKVGENTLENMEDGKITTSIKNGTKQNLTQSDAEKTEHSVVNGSNSTVNKQTSEEITDAVTNGTTTNVTQNTATSSNNTIADKNGNANTVISTVDGTSFINSKAAAPVTGASGDGTAVNTTIKGNTITTGKVTMDYADVMKDLGVRGNANITGKTTTGSLEVTGTSTLKGDVTMESNATVKKDLTVEGNTNLKNTKVDGTLDVTQKATFGDSVSIAKDLSVDGNATIKGDVTAKSYKVGDKTYISAAGINANDQKITNVADGSISEGSKDAVNGGQLYGVKNDLEGKVNKVGANAAAMANLHPMEFDPDSKWNIAAAIGNYGSETAAALGAFYRPNDDVMVNLSTAFGTGENMVGGGVSVRLGKGGNKLSREETNALKAQVADLTARMDALLSVLNPNMSKDFPDVPENHWAYEAVSRLAGNDIVQGYPDGEFHGERTMTRYEMAEIIYNALSRGAEAEKELVEEFKPELQAMAASEKATAERAEG